jgi:CheY-like chemotaxis protein
MDEATLARAAEPFFTTKGVGKGTGLGLSMVHGLAAQSGGALRLSSCAGEGCRVELWLPATLQPAPVKAAEVRGSLFPVQSPRRLRVLLVDDDPLVATGTAAMLEDLGHEVAEANSGGQALEILSSEGGFDLVITDQAMPGMTGRELAATLQATHPDLPVLLASGYAELPSDEGGILSLPRLSKPYTQADLTHVLDNFLRRSEPPRGCAGEASPRF